MTDCIWTGTLWRRRNSLGQVVAIDLVTAVDNASFYLERHTLLGVFRTKVPRGWYITPENENTAMMPDGVSLATAKTELRYPATVILRTEANALGRIAQCLEDGNRVFATNDSLIKQLLESAAGRMGFNVSVEVVGNG